MLSNILKSATATAAAPSADPNFKQTVLLLHGDGTNGAQNNTFVDGSSNNFTITRNGNTTQGTFTPFSAEAGKWSNFFDGTGDWLSISDNTAFDFGNGNFTIECWVYQTSGTGAQYVVSQNTATLSTSQFDININAGSVSGTVYYGSSFVATSATSLPLNTWTHLALVRNGSTLTLYKDGVSSGTGSIGTNTLNNPTGEIRVGAINNATTPYPFIGYISNLRIVKGTAVYTSNFTQPTTPLTAITNTSLLTCQDNRFRDASSNNFAITRNGDVRVTPFGPFAPSAAYSASVNGGSGYFDGTGDNLTTSSAITAAGDFTIEGWMYIRSLSTTPDLLVIGNESSGRWAFFISTAGRPALDRFGIGTTTFGSNNAVRINEWTHVAFVRSSGTITAYVNGSSVGTASLSGTVGNTNLFKSGSNTNGYLSNVRYLNGTALYTSNFTPPTAPLSAITNTSLLLNFTNAGIIDSTGKNVLETIADAQIDTTVKKYGTGALEFDGTGDILQTPTNPDLDFDNGNWTVELWVNFNSSSPVSMFFWTPVNHASGFRRLQCYLSNTGQLAIAWFGTVVTTSSGLTWSANQWYHLAYVRNGNTWTIYRNGTSVASTTNTNSLQAASGYQIGQAMNGYIDDMRVTKGVARYTANFTPPTAAFLDQ